MLSLKKVIRFFLLFEKNLFC